MLAGEGTKKSLKYPLLRGFNLPKAIANKWAFLRRA